ncbi:MAG: hypothetical protein KKC03_12495 [Bacteroidetes bacterium]|nr:hypothetical protein [Bacteroidota bacterium]
MSSTRVLKKNINTVFGDLIESAYLVQLSQENVATEKVEAIVDEAIEKFDSLISKINQKDVAEKKAHFKSIHQELEKATGALVEKINQLA